MAINPLQLPSYTTTNLDFTPLSQIAQGLKENRQQAARQEALGQYAGGDPSALLRSGDMTLTQLYMQDQAKREQAARDARDFAFRQQEAQRAQGNADRSYGLQARTADRLEDRTPAGFEPNPDAPGSIRPIPGGPQSPQFKTSVQDADFAAGIERRKKAALALNLEPGSQAYNTYVATETMPAVKQRDLPSGVVKDLNERGGTYEDFNRLSTGFNDAYGGFKTGIAGDVANLAARNLGIGNTEGAAWWQDYQNQKNIVRNKLFGSALTSTEKAEFDKANINPGMTPGAIRANLKLQTDAARRAAAKLANTYSKMGYSSDHIEAALGMPLSDVQKPAVSSAAVVDYRTYFGDGQ